MSGNINQKKNINHFFLELRVPLHSIFQLDFMWLCVSSDFLRNWRRKFCWEKKTLINKFASKQVYWKRVTQNCLFCSTLSKWTSVNWKVEWEENLSLFIWVKRQKRLLRYQSSKGKKNGIRVSVSVSRSLILNYLSARHLLVISLRDTLKEIVSCFIWICSFAIENDERWRAKDCES